MVDNLRDGIFTKTKHAVDVWPESTDDYTHVCEVVYDAGRRLETNEEVYSGGVLVQKENQIDGEKTGFCIYDYFIGDEVGSQSYLDRLFW